MFGGSMKRLVITVVALLSTVISLALAHQTREVGSGKYKVIVGMVKEPAFTEERNGLDLIIRDAQNNPVENLAKSLQAEITTPDGKGKRTLTLRAQFGKPGYYTDDFILTQPGVYKIRVWGKIVDVDFDETFESHEVKALSSLRF
jgi:hypothetical protein